jgi:hypothetical protein
MALFGANKIHAFGLDIADSSVKVSELTLTRGILKSAVFADVPLLDKTITNHMIVNEERLAGNILKAVAQAHSIDSWSYFQAKSTKQSIAENTLEMITLQKTSDSVVKKYEGQIARYAKEKNEIKGQAEGYAKQYDDLNVFDDQFDMTEALLTICIAMFGITALTHKRWLFWFSFAMSLLGIILGLTAFMGISLHSDFMAKILG